ncbi:MAG: GAF domain-containing protein, partial [Chloroflexi bacterium]|nr:GAF domain-containing protein [Chloroflexota bacterium]
TQPVLDTVVQNAARLCEAEDATVFRLEGDQFVLAAVVGSLPHPPLGTPFPIRRDMPIGRAMLEGRTVHVNDLAVEVNDEFAASKRYQEQYGIRSSLAMPLLRDGAARGVIYIWRAEVRPFNERHVALLKTFADQAVIAIENVRLFNETTRLLKETEQRAAELAIINSVQQGLASKLDMQAIYDLVGDKIRETFQVQDVFIGHYDPQSGTINFPFAVTAGERDTLLPIPMGVGLSSYVVRSRQPLLINRDMATRGAELGVVLDRDRHRHIKSWVGIPIIKGDEAIGIISLHDTESEEAFGDSDVNLLSTLAASMSVAMENARLFDELQRRASEMTALTEIGREITATLDQQQVLNAIAAHAQRVLNARDVVVRLLDDDGNLPVVLAVGKHADVLAASSMRLGEGITGSIAQSGVAEIVNDPLNDARMRHVAGTEDDEAKEAIIFAPLVARE